MEENHKRVFVPKVAVNQRYQNYLRVVREHAERTLSDVIREALRKEVIIVVNALAERFGGDADRAARSIGVDLKELCEP
ncbi:MAG: hypothetical protein JW839_02095 [Candidatus Lokiarchaeota archaeon]|nr:hypothetical protein [Candidatus Lokiarchaeota archaeon]